MYACHVYIYTLKLIKIYKISLNNYNSIFVYYRYRYKN